MPFSAAVSSYFFEVISGRRTTPDARLARAALCVPAYCLWRPLSAIGRYYRLYGPLRPYRAGCPVISVGNITAGGTGKTPMVEWVCARLMELGRKPAILTHAYRAGGEAENEETRLLAGRFSAVPVLSGKNRSALARDALAEGLADCLLLDDGFQHLALQRDLDIVLVDCLQPFGYEHPIPRGLLREPLKALERADIIVLTRSDKIGPELKAAIRDRISSAAGTVPVAEAVHKPTQLINSSGKEPKNPESLDKMKVMLFSAIGNPPAFESTIMGLGADIRKHFTFRDHHRYTRTDLETLAREAGTCGCKAVITTEKDYVKLKNRWPAKIPLYVLRVELRITDGKEQLNRLMNGALYG